MNIKPDTLRTEIDQIQSILDGWKRVLSEGIPGDELPASDLNSEIFEIQLKGELSLCSERLAALVEVLS